LLTTPRPEYLRPRLRRNQWFSLNGPWQFAFDSPEFDRTIIVPFAYRAELSGIGAQALHDTERNGLLTFDRQLKVDSAVLLPLTQIAKRR
jgi:hypothetical protein